MLLRVKMGYKSMHPDVEGAGGGCSGGRSPIQFDVGICDYIDFL